jgi:maltose O-acetyltransferase
MTKNIITKSIHEIGVMLRDLLINSIASSVICCKPFRYIIYRLYGIKTKTMNISPHCYFGGNSVIIGENTFINHNCFFDVTGEIEIGKNCNIGHSCYLLTPKHKISSAKRRAGEVSGEKIVIGDGTWIAANVTILPGIKIGKGVVIGAGSVVIEDCNDDSVYAGNPAKFIRSIE